MGANSSSSAVSSVPINSQGLEHCPPHQDIKKPLNITNNNSSDGIKTAKVASASNNGLKNELINLNGIGHSDDPSSREKTKLDWDNHVPLMDPSVVDMLVQKMEMMRMMKKMGGSPPMGNGQTPNGTVVDGKVPNGTTLDGKLTNRTMLETEIPNGTVIDGKMMNGTMLEEKVSANGHPLANGTTTPFNRNMTSNGTASPNGMHLRPNGMDMPDGTVPMNGKMPPKFPKLMGSTENTIRLVRHMKAVFNSAEIQDLCDEKLDCSGANLMFKMMQCKLEMEFKFLNDIGMGHLTQLVASGKLPPVLHLIFICYQDDPEVLKELAFVGPVFSKRPDLAVRRGDAVPNIILRTCSEEAVSLNDLHVNKNLPLVIFAASSSCPPLQACLVGGTLSELVETYRTQVEFLVVYLEEAHAKGEFGMGSKLSRNSKHASIHDRINAAKDLVALDKSHFDCMSEDIVDTDRLRVVVDTMDNSFTSRFDAFPDRAFIIHQDEVAFIGSDIMDQMEHPDQLMTDEVRSWLQQNL